MTVIDVANALKAALKELGIVGQFDLRMDGSRATSWIGQPGGEDKLIIVRIDPYPEDEKSVAE